MGSHPAPPPQTVYLPAPPPPAPPTPVPTQSLDTQLALMQATNAQTQLNMTLGAQIDQSNYAFNTTQDISKADDAAANLRLQTATEGEQTRANTAATAEQQRTTNLQQEMFRRYQNNLDYNRATDAYHA